MHDEEEGEGEEDSCDNENHVPKASKEMMVKWGKIAIVVGLMTVAMNSAEGGVSLWKGITMR